MLGATFSSKFQVAFFLKDSNSINLGDFFQGKIERLIETNKFSTFKYKLDTMESEEKKKEIGNFDL